MNDKVKWRDAKALRDRIEELEVKLAKVEEALQQLALEILYTDQTMDEGCCNRNACGQRGYCMINHIEDLEAKLSTAVGLLSRAIGTTGEPHCYHDHHGYCQAHNLEPRGECWVEQSQVLIAEMTGDKDE